MHEEGSVRSGQRVEHVAKSVAVEMLELRRAGIGEEAFESKGAVIQHRVELGCVAGNRASPKADVDPALPLHRLGFGQERFDGSRWRDAVERHVDQGGHPARRCRPRGGLESLPIRPPRLVDVDVRVDEAGHDDEVAVVDIGAFPVLADAVDASALDVNRRRARAGWRDHGAAAEDHQSMPSAIQTSPPSGLKRSNISQRPSGDQTG